jgi:hypothetical protein
MRTASSAIPIGGINLVAQLGAVTSLTLGEFAFDVSTHSVEPVGELFYVLL